ncbi:hypothetical protein [Pedobacter rhizosphaerae]|uniref:Uncharacterized protein n=1 Tax=Pedobacter rhizosphaerae TaxID=390241 RepID=A0A1H9KN59_9SPHI|nr:hypothetical protein [Pedobacter rhizosphaerae]SER00528.1 hypothetical protein SAMN04488023_10371 [Pedobacter rhizosphaerae]
MKTKFSLLFYLKKQKNYVSGNVPKYMRITVEGNRAEISPIGIATLSDGTPRAAEPSVPKKRSRSEDMAMLKKRLAIV